VLYLAHIRGITKAAIILVCMPFDISKKVIDLISDEDNRMELVMEMAKTSQMHIDEEMIGVTLGALFYYLFGKNIRNMSAEEVIFKIENEINVDPQKAASYIETLLTTF
jgi:hypothetical protein